MKRNRFVSKSFIKVKHTIKSSFEHHFESTLLLVNQYKKLPNEPEFDKQEISDLFSRHFKNLTPQTIVI